MIFCTSLDIFFLIGAVPSLKLVANLPPVTTPGVLVAKFAACFVDTGGASSLVNISATFQKNLK
jgi:hypothetical protein